MSRAKDVLHRRYAVETSPTCDRGIVIQSMVLVMAGPLPASMGSKHLIPQVVDGGRFAVLESEAEPIGKCADPFGACPEWLRPDRPFADTANE